MVEANALRSGDPGATARRCRRFAARARGAAPFFHCLAWRALAYVADATGRPEQALTHLARAEREAELFGQRIDVAIARHQRGLRLGGDEGAALQQQARALLAELGAGEQLLAEDAGQRYTGTH